MNKTLIFITFAALVGLALVGTLTLLFVAPQHFGTFTGFIIVLLGLVATFATTVSALERQKQELNNIKTETSAKLDVVQKQTNGTLTKLIEKNHEHTTIIQERDAEIAQLRAMLDLPAKGGNA